VKYDYLILLLVTLHFALSEKHSGLNPYNARRNWQLSFSCLYCYCLTGGEWRRDFSSCKNSITGLLY